MGIMSNGKLLHGMLHPEAGHILMRKHPEDHYEGKCPYHKTCLEGLAAGPAIEARWGKKGIELADKKEVWELEAYYIGQALVDLILVAVSGKNYSWWRCYASGTYDAVSQRRVRNRWPVILRRNRWMIWIIILYFQA